MANLKSYLGFTILGLFLFVSVFGFINNFAEATETTLTDNFTTTTTTEFRETLSTQKNKIDDLSDEAVTSNPDTDSNDILGSWLVAGFQNVRNTISGAKEMTTTATTSVETVAQYLKPESHVTATIYLYLALLILIIVLAVIIQKSGVSQ